MLGHFQKANTTPKRKVVEFRDWDGANQLGDVLTVDIFNEDRWLILPVSQRVKDSKCELNVTVSVVWVVKPTVSTTVSVTQVLWVLHRSHHAFSPGKG
jgi:hypothetical protein